MISGPLEDLEAHLGRGADPVAWARWIPDPPTLEEFRRGLAADAVILSGGLTPSQFAQAVPAAEAPSEEELPDLFARYVRTMVEIIDASDGGFGEVQSRLDAIQSRERYFEAMVAACAGIHRRMVMGDAQCRMARIACLAHDFRQRRGRFPLALADLGELPIDPLSSGSFRLVERDTGLQVESPYVDTLDPSDYRRRQLTWRLID